MALPIAHATAGYLIHRLDGRRGGLDGWSRALAFMALANLPDADFLVGFVLGRPGAFHRGVSHTMLAALVVGGAFGALASRRSTDRWWRTSLVLAAVYASHLLVDAFTIDERGPAGAQFFWPLSTAYYIAPITVFGEIIIDGASRTGFVASVLRWPTVLVLVREAAIAIVAVGTFNLLEPWVRQASPADGVAIDLATPSGEEDVA
jgi:inner membrane protein